MTETLITFETAVVAKEKGFEMPIEPFNSIYDPEDNQLMTYVHRDTIMKLKNIGMETIFAPTQNLLQKWLREEFNIFVYPVPYIEFPNNAWKCELRYISTAKSKHPVETYVLPKWDRGVENPGTYEEALEEGLKQALKLI